ncbi:phenylalanine--tRNA ligase subunit alpha [candidate division WWE3 bacterium CG_4_9_14_3_um_filter_41_6]|uniref:phenylalanine--tRNA ligase n=1 Tax=candidate division WWE3 bacterium CG_4_10_14_0_2_um_filter_41_14 TaxID=1975072 RepID=A0A2M7TM24_UNCKA|nr:MAG: phenylalanine--tRNA ligase subunit alpha [candidate division WWE3 bacterium CG_4_10_14_0_2_um_filter_41_14]PJA38548.1 MAG: phenylalanine--tRNA ligase subunit alpha [candidate division WWE3 bacterium CG_4_9_14_3_um_filter_41_6]
MSIDMTTPGTVRVIGHQHPVTQTYKEVTDIFRSLGFETIEARLVNSPDEVFTHLNFAKDHPARDIMDTFYLDDGMIPIPHTSSMQNTILTSCRESLETKPIAAIIAGRCFRNEKLDQTHEATFYQLEGLYVNKHVRVSDLIGTLMAVGQRISDTYALELEFKVLTTYFPFVEPGIEILAKKKNSDSWMELIPAGMIHPNVLTAAGIDSKIYNGFAWAVGIDRLTMLRYNITDIRWFHSGDIRFLQQF